MLHAYLHDVATIERRSIDASIFRPRRALFLENLRIHIGDLTMPRMDGIQTHEELKKIREDVVVVVASGYTEESTTRRFGDRKPAGFIQKPYLREELRKKISQVLGLDSG